MKDKTSDPPISCLTITLWSWCITLAAVLILDWIIRQLLTLIP